MPRIPMAATPEADPMMRMLPPVPAHRASNDQNSLSGANWLKGYMPMAAATSGTLSTMADSRPIAVFTA